jgi:transposase-like protein
VNGTSTTHHRTLHAVAPGEDPELTAYLNRHIAAVLSPSHEPRPSCPRCGATHVSSAGFKMRAFGRLPQFECQSCGREYNRAWGTPLSEKHLKKLDLFVSLLSQPLSCEEAGRQMGSLSADLSQRVKAFRAWLLQLDPRGTWEQRVRLGGRRTEIRPAPLAFAETGAREDIVLTARLTREFDELHSMSHTPIACPDCGNRHTHFSGHAPRTMPRFECRVCRLRFTRRRGTPFVRTELGSVARLRDLIRYLSLPLPFIQVAELLGTSAGMVQKWRDTFARWADQLEPDGSLSARFRLGVEPTAATPCPFCGRTGVAMRAHYAWSCAGCGRLFSMRRTLVETAGTLQLVDEMADTQATAQGAAAVTASTITQSSHS